MFLSQYYGERQQAAEIANPALLTLLCLDDDDTLIAFAQLRGDEIARFYVDPEHHGRGVAQTLMDATLAAAREAGVQTIWLGVWEKNPRAIAFYAKCGFRDTGSQPFLVGTDLQTDRIMTREL
jgi:ribosomal protein S18 acetylase RimI-like enzyme